MIHWALQAAGVEFIDENGGGPRVRLRQPKRPRTYIEVSNLGDKERYVTRME